MNSIFEKVSRFMYGRNGIDKLSFFTLVMYLLLNGIKMFFRFRRVPYFVLWVIALVFLAITIFRVLSKNVYKRQDEEQKFEKFFYRFLSSGFYKTMRKKLNRAGIRISQAGTHRFRTCPNCNEHLRMSKKRGKRSITCPKCGKQFKVFIPF